MPIPVNFTSPARMSAKKRAFQQIQEWIIDGTLKPLEKLNDADLAHALGVSRTPIREALQLLSAQGFVRMFPGVGTQVTDVDAEDITKILPPLGALQALAAELAIDHLQPQDIAELRRLNDQFARLYHAGDIYNALKIDEQLHHFIVEKANNPYVTNTVSNLQAHVMRLYFHQSIIVTEASIEEHEELIAALEAKDKTAAAMIARKNWLRAIEEYFADRR